MDAQPHFFDGQLTTLIDTWSTTIDDMSALICELTDAEWNLPSPCPGWTVGDIAAHVVGVERRLAGDALADHEPDWSTLPNIRSDEFSQFMERDVDIRRTQSRTETVAELLEVIPRRRAQLQALDADPELMVAGPAGSQVPLGRIMRMRVFDLWVHEQDIRQSVHKPGHEASIGAHVTAEILVSALPVIWGKKVAAQPGQSIHLKVSGAISFECSVVVGDDGRAGFTANPDQPTSSLAMDWLTYVALSTGRSTVELLADQITIAGDAELAHRCVKLANIAP